MADIKIANLTAKTTWADTDIIIVEDSSDTKKMTVATLKSLLNTPPTPTLISAFQNSWANYDISTFNAAGYYVFQGRCYLQGLIKSGLANNDIAFNLPVGVRPSKIQFLNSICSDPTADKLGKVRIETNGDVKITGYNTWFNLDGMSFKL